MNNVYIYEEDNFLSFLTLIKYLLDKKIKPYNIGTSSYQSDLFTNIINLNLRTDEKIILKFKKEFGINNFRIIFYVYLSNELNKEIIIYYYLLNYFKYHENLGRMRNLKCVSETLRIFKKVQNEAHRFKGFVRFKEINQQFFYAEIAPDNNILFLLARHFQKRLKSEYWIIKDTKRKILSIYDKKHFYIVPDENMKLTYNISVREQKMMDLWCAFYEAIGIKERKNNRCRMNFMPKKYWPNIIEVEKEL